MSDHRRRDDLDQAAADLRDSAQRFANAWLGADTSGHLRESLRHALLAARSVIDQAEQSLARGCDNGPGHSAAHAAGHAADPGHTTATESAE